MLYLWLPYQMYKSLPQTYKTVLHPRSLTASTTTSRNHHTQARKLEFGLLNFLSVSFIVLLHHRSIALQHNMASMSIFLSYYARQHQSSGSVSTQNTQRYGSTQRNAPLLLTQCCLTISHMTRHRHGTDTAHTYFVTKAAPLDLFNRTTMGANSNSKQWESLSL